MKQYHVISAKNFGYESDLGDGTYDYFVFPADEFSQSDIMGLFVSVTKYTQKNNKETGPAVVGIELEKKEDLDGLIFRLENHHFEYQYLNTDNTLFSLMIG